MAALSRFLSRFGDKGLPFFKLLKAGEKFEWSEEADVAFTQLKQYGVQRPIYFISEVLNESKTRYTQIQKLIYAILITTRNLKHYFDEFHVLIKTEFPLGTIIRNKDANGCIAKWAMELCPFDLEFTCRDTIKSQTLADFVVEWTDLSIPTSQGPVDYLKMYFDGSLAIDGVGAGILFISPTNEQLRYVLRIHFPASNNAAEYEACFHGLRIAVDLGIKRLYVHATRPYLLTSSTRTGIQLARR
jgi:hypothetical protein